MAHCIQACQCVWLRWLHQVELNDDTKTKFMTVRHCMHNTDWICLLCSSLPPVSKVLFNSVVHLPILRKLISIMLCTKIKHRFFFKASYLIKLTGAKIIYHQWWANGWVWNMGGKTMTWENSRIQRNLFQCHTVHNKYHTY